MICCEAGQTGVWNDPPIWPLYVNIGENELRCALLVYCRRITHVCEDCDFPLVQDPPEVYRTEDCTLKVVSSEN
jgi:hypothetical protein